MLTGVSLPELWLAGFGVSVLDFFWAFASRIGTGGCFASFALMLILGGALLFFGCTPTSGLCVCVIVDSSGLLVTAA